MRVLSLFEKKMRAEGVGAGICSRVGTLVRE